MLVTGIKKNSSLEQTNIISKTKRNNRIDYIKAICIMSVIVLHTLPVEILEKTLSRFHIWNAVPMFIILMAFTTYISSSKKELKLKSLYNMEYVKKKVFRILIPIFAIVIFEIILARIFQQEMYIGLKSFMGYLPITGPGNYYISILIQYTILAPLFYFLYKKNRVASTTCAFVINFIGEVLLNYCVQDNFIYSSCIIRYLFLVYLGFNLYDIIEKATNNKQQTRLYMQLAAQLDISHYRYILENTNFQSEME